MSREALGRVMASIGITRYTSTTVDDALVRFDETGQGQSLGPGEFAKLLADRKYSSFGTFERKGFGEEEKG